MLLYKLIKSNENCLLKSAKVQRPVVPFELWGAGEITPTREFKKKKDKSARSKERTTMSAKIE